MKKRPDAKGKPKKKKVFSGRRSKFCKFCVEKSVLIDYKDIKTLQGFTPERGKVLPRRTSGVCANHQRMLVESIKRARNIALLPFAAQRTSSTVTVQPPPESSRFAQYLGELRS